MGQFTVPSCSLNNVFDRMLVFKQTTCSLVIKGHKYDAVYLDVDVASIMDTKCP